jgi:hypothetical protein
MGIDYHDSMGDQFCWQDRESNNHADTKDVTRAKNTLEAVQLVQLGARAALVCQLTGLTKKVVGRLYPSLTGRSSPPGQVPFTDTWYMRSNQRKLHANVVWHLYQHLGRNEHCTASELISVYQAYKQIVGTPLLTLTRAFFVPRLIAINAWYEQTCDHCTMSYIGALGNDGSTCPACAEYFKRRCRNCGAAIEYRRVGRWKKFCTQCDTQQKRSKKRFTGRLNNDYSEA